MRKREKEKEEEKKEWKEQQERRLALCVRVVRARLAICVVFYDNYKYGHKALCLE